MRLRLMWWDLDWCDETDWEWCAETKTDVMRAPGEVARVGCECASWFCAHAMALCGCVRVYLNVFVSVNVGVGVSLYVSVDVCARACACVCARACACVCVRALVHVYVCASCLCMCVCVCASCLCMCVCASCLCSLWPLRVHRLLIRSVPRRLCGSGQGQPAHPGSGERWRDVQPAGGLQTQGGVGRLWGRKACMAGCGGEGEGPCVVESTGKRSTSRGRCMRGGGREHRPRPRNNRWVGWNHTPTGWHA